MEQDMRSLVQQGYEKGNYVNTYSRTSRIPEAFEKALCDQLLERLPENAKILDLGCGVGLPYDAYFIAQGAKLTGIDITTKHVEEAKNNVPEANYIQGDFFSESIQGRFDAIVSFYAIFHIPREEHAKLLQHVHTLLSPNGYILITLGADTMELDTNNDFAGATMAWSSYTVEENKQLVENAGFTIALTAEDYRTEKHLWILAQKK